MFVITFSLICFVAGIALLSIVPFVCLMYMYLTGSFLMTMVWLNNVSTPFTQLLIFFRGIILAIFISDDLVCINRVYGIFENYEAHFKIHRKY